MMHHECTCDWCRSRAPINEDGHPVGWTNHQGDDLCNLCLAALIRHKSAAVNAARAERQAVRTSPTGSEETKGGAT